MIEIIPEIEINQRIIELKSIEDVEERRNFWVGKYFQWKEFWSGDPVTGYKSVEPPYMMWSDAIEHILYMDRVREYCGWGVRYSSGYRTIVWNKIWKGAEYSDHLYSKGGDMVPLGRITIHKFAMIIAMLTPLDHFGVYNGINKWVHAGNNDNKKVLYRW